MNLITLVIILLLVFLLTGGIGASHFQGNYVYGGGVGLGTILVILIVLKILGVI